MNTKVSVIIPIYNKEKYIGKCIDSLLLQDYGELEIVAVNDGSSDDTAAVLERYGDKIKLITTENRGVASARNTGLENATGGLILFLDADDYYEQNTVRDLVKRQAETGADILRFGYRIILPDGNVKLPADPFTHNVKIEKDEFKKYVYPYFINGIMLNSVCLAMYKKSCIDGLRFREDMKTAEDAVFNLDAYTNAQSTVFLSDIYYCYVRSRGSLTGSGLSLAEKYKDNFTFSDEIRKRLDIWGLSSVHWRIKAYMRPFFLTFDKIFRKLGL